MKKKTLLLVIAILALGLSSAFAGNANRVGTGGGQELVIPVGSRGTAMGGAVVANSSGVDAIFWNPAGLADLYEGTEAMFMHLPYIADINVEYAALATAIEDFGTIGVSVKVTDIGDIEETTELYPDGTGRLFNPTMTVVGLTFAKPLTNAISFGLTGFYIHEAIDEVSASGLAMDFGFTYQTKYDGLKFGFVMKNYGPDMSFSGSGFERTPADEKRSVSSENASFELPTSINLGLSYNFLTSGANAFVLSGNFRANNQANDYWQGGVEYAYSEKFFVRTGYNYSDQEGFIYGASLGLGAALPVGNSTLTLEYTWTETEVFDNNQFYTAKFSF
ncbi:MAG: PorV/PorQ family protein [bacterium]|nr:PorV/PorQ family protein [bacterium]